MRHRKKIRLLPVLYLTITFACVVLGLIWKGKSVCIFKIWYIASVVIWGALWIRTIRLMRISDKFKNR